MPERVGRNGTAHCRRTLKRPNARSRRGAIRWRIDGGAFAPAGHLGLLSTHQTEALGVSARALVGSRRRSACRICNLRGGSALWFGTEAVHQIEISLRWVAKRTTARSARGFRRGKALRLLEILGQSKRAGTV